MARPKTKFTFEEWCRIVYDAQIYREQMRDPDWVFDAAQRYGLLDYERPEEEFSLRCLFNRWEIDG